MQLDVRSELISEYLKSRRVELGLTQYDVARRLGYSSPQFVSNWERGLANIPKKVFPKLIKIYRMETKETKQLLFAEAQRQVEQIVDGLFKRHTIQK